MRAKWLTRFLDRWLGYPNRFPDFLIGPEGNPYMERWWIIPRNKFFNIYLHNILHDDDDRALHDHPWWSVSFCLHGDILEVYRKKGSWLEGKRCIGKGDIVFRNGADAHRLELVTKEAKTLFITGPRFREWGFHCPQGWRPWFEFTKSGKPGQMGKGCGD